MEMLRIVIDQAGYHIRCFPLPNVSESLDIRLERWRAFCTLTTQPGSTVREIFLLLPIQGRLVGWNCDNMCIEVVWFLSWEMYLLRTYYTSCLSTIYHIRLLSMLSAGVLMYMSPAPTYIRFSTGSYVSLTLRQSTDLIISPSIGWYMS